MSKAVLKGPKLKGAAAIPHGELSTPLEAKRRSKLPLVSKISTNPWPGPATSSCFLAFCSANVTTRLPLILPMPNGAYPAGNCGSRKLPLTVAGWKLPSKTSIVAQRKLVAYRNTPAVFAPTASPLYMAPVAPLPHGSVDLSATNAAGLKWNRPHGARVPSSVANMNGAPAVPPGTMNAKVGFATTPVGAAVLPPGEGGGIVTARGKLLP